jgi:hypothetical protein
MNHEVAVREEVPPAVLEVKALARHLANAYQDRVCRIRFEQELSTEEALAKAAEPCSLSRAWRIEERQPEEVTWGDLEELRQRSPEQALALWEEVKKAAREELHSGHRAGGALLGPHPRAFDLARFLALREDLTEGWQPRDGVERQLIDQTAQAQAAMNFWLERHFSAASGGDTDESERAGAMAERFHKMFVRTLKLLQELRRHPPAVVVQNVGGQVNVAAAQQVNLAHGANGRNGDARPGGRARCPRGQPAACTCPADGGNVITQNGRPRSLECRHRQEPVVPCPTEGGNGRVPAAVED